ncbi:MAG: hypothetical protein ACLULH_09050 [Bacteroides fragilis]
MIARIPRILAAPRWRCRWHSLQAPPAFWRLHTGRACGDIFRQCGSGSFPVSWHGLNDMLLDERESGLNPWMLLHFCTELY